ncbi:MAG: DUF1109 domain-containing protein [Alphaproteobacteria bacterium]|nr:DUF1109 domain-containing protein [Alphaproteobacteria bacterium]
MMETDALILTLSRDARAPAGRSALRTLLACVAGALAYCVVAVLAIEGARPDFVAAAPWVAMKAGVSLAFALGAIPLALRLARPGQGTGPWAAASLALFAFFLVVGSLALGFTGARGRIEALTGGSFPHSVIVIPTLAIPVAALLFLWLRSRAPTRLATAGAAVGALAGGLSAMAYALICPVDTVAFVVTWYPLAIAICAGLGAWAGSWALRW